MAWTSFTSASIRPPISPILVIEVWASPSVRPALRRERCRSARVVSLAMGDSVAERSSRSNFRAPTMDATQRAASRLLLLPVTLSARRTRAAASARAVAEGLRKLLTKSAVTRLFDRSVTAASTSSRLTSRPEAADRIMASARRMWISPLGVVGPQAPGAGQLVDHALDHRHPHGHEGVTGQMGAQSLRLAFQSWDQGVDLRVGAGHGLHHVIGGEAHHGPQLRPQIRGRAEKGVHGRPGAQHLRQHLLQHEEGDGAGLAHGRRRVRQIQQPPELVRPVGRPPQIVGDAPAEQIAPVRMVLQRGQHGGEGLRRDLGEGLLAAVLDHPLDRLFHQGLEAADQLVHRYAPGLGLGNGDLLDGVLDLHAGGVQLLHQVRTVQQLEGGHGLASQPAVQQAVDDIPGMHRVKVRRGDAERRFVLQPGTFRLDDLDHPVGQDHAGAVSAGLLVQGFLGHPDGDGLAAGHQLLGHFETGLPVLAGEVQTPTLGGVSPNEEFEMDLGV